MRYGVSHVDEVQSSRFLSIGIGNWHETQMYLTDGRIAIEGFEIVFGLAINFIRSDLIIFELKTGH